MSKEITKQQQITGWVVFDWANSAYNLVIVSTVFPIIFKAFVPDGSEFIGITFKSSDSLYTYAMCFSYLIISIITPILSGIADYGGYKKRYMQFFSTMGAFACASLFLFGPDHQWIGIFGVIIASIGFSGSLVFYNGFLSEIVPKKLHDKVSAKGFSYGYLGSSILLILIILLDRSKELFGVLNEKDPIIFRIGFILVGIWWFGWARWTFSVLPKGKKTDLPKKEMMAKGFEELKHVWHQLKQLPRLKRFLSAFFIIDLGVQTIVIIAPLFAIKVFGMEGGELVPLVLIMQFLGIAGALIFSKISRKYGNIAALIGPTIVYLSVCILACIANNASIINEKPGVVIYENFKEGVNYKTNTIIINKNKKQESIVIKNKEGNTIPIIKIIEKNDQEIKYPLPVSAVLKVKNGENIKAGKTIAVIPSQRWIIYLIAAMIGFAMGGIQSLFRSTYSKLLPNTKDHASFFSFFDITEKIAIVVGLFVYAGVEVIASGMKGGFAEKLGVATLGLFFLVGLLLLRRLGKFKPLKPTTEDF